MVSQVRDGISERAVARSFRVSLSTVQRWMARAADLPLDEVDWDARPAGCRVSPRRTKAGVEQRVERAARFTAEMAAVFGYAAEHADQTRHTFPGKSLYAQLTTGFGSTNSCRTRMVRLASRMD